MRVLQDPGSLTDGQSLAAVAGGDAARGGLPQEPNTAAFGAASATTTVYGWNQLYRTTDGGSTWTKTGPTEIKFWQYVGFTDPIHGVAIAQTASGAEQAGYTTDGDASYPLVQVR